MADTFTPNLGLTLMENGTHNNTWNDEYISNDERIDAKLGDVTTVNSTGGTTVLSGDQERVNVVKATGTLVSNKIIEFSGIGGAWIIQNDHTGAFTLTVRKTGQTGVTIDQGTKKLVYFDGTDIAVLSAETAANLGLGTGDSPQFAAVNVGAASDTTVARSEAGVIAVEGKRILNAAFCSFRAHKTATQAISAATLTTVTWVEQIDTGAAFASNAWTPNKAGNVSINCGLLVNPAATGQEITIFVVKNGTRVKGVNKRFADAGVNEHMLIDYFDSANGTTDVYTIQIMSAGSCGIEFQTLLGSISACWFSGRMV